MAERAHPDNDYFRRPWRLRLRAGFLPWIKINQFRLEFDRRYKWVNFHSKGKSVLDVPCGMGWGTSRITHALSRTGLDISEEAISEACTRYPSDTFILGSMEVLPFPYSSFDIVSCLEGIEHVPVSVGKSFISEAARVLKNEGRLLLSSPYCKDGSHSGNPYHIHEYQPDEISDLVETCFIIDKWFERRVEEITIRYIMALPRA